MTRATLLLTMTVTYDLDGTPVGDLIDNLLAVPTLAMQNGMLTGDTAATVVIADPRVQQIG